MRDKQISKNFEIIESLARYYLNDLHARKQHLATHAGGNIDK